MLHPPGAVHVLCSSLKQVKLEDPRAGQDQYHYPGPVTCSVSPGWLKLTSAEPTGGTWPSGTLQVT